MSSRRCELHERRELRKLREAQLYANEQRRHTADLDTEGGKGQSESKNHGGETYYCRNRCIDGLFNMPASAAEAAGCERPERPRPLKKLLV